VGVEQRVLPVHSHPQTQLAHERILQIQMFP
jgi:hypothetical protein